MPLQFAPSILLASLGWVCFALACRGLLRASPRQFDASYALGILVTRVYCLMVHRVKASGIENLPGGPTPTPGPVIVVVNHTAGIDPILVQAVLPFEVRWMMARDMMVARYEKIWSWLGVIPVSREGSRGDAGAAREAIRHVMAGGVLGVFPEGGIERPPRQLRPFQPGVGLIIRKTGARVLPILVEGTPTVETAFESLLRTSRSRLTILPMIDYAGTTLGAQEIADDLQGRFKRRTGWPVSAADPKAPTP